MRLKAIIALAVLGFCLSGCATDFRTPATLVVKISRVSSVVVMMGDLAGDWVTYTLQPVEPAGEPFQALALRECPSFDPSQLYRVRIERRAIVYGLTNQTDRKTITDLVVTACEAVKGP